MENIFSRIRKFIDYKNISNNEFGRKIGHSSAQVTQMLTHEKNFGIDKLLKIISNYPDINPNWLLTGKGNMLLTHTTFHKSDKPVAEIAAEMDIEIGETLGDKIQEQKQENSDFIDKLLNRLEVQSQEIGRLKAEIKLLKEEKKQQNMVVNSAIVRADVA